MPAFIIPTLTVLAIAIVAIVFAVIVIKSCWRIAGTNEVLIVSGLGASKRKTGGGIFVIPLFQRVQRLTLENIQVDFVSKTDIPTKDAINIRVDAVANMAISQDPARQEIAASKFANYSLEDIKRIMFPILEGNIREILSQTPFEDLIRGDKEAFSQLIKKSAEPDLAEFGIDLTTFNIQSFADNDGIINDLGIENVQKIKKEARIAAAEAEAEVKIAEAKADEAANAAKVAAATEIARRQTEFAVQKAQMQEQADTAQAKADAAKQIEAENQRKAREIAEAEANLARQEKAIELQEREVAIQERKLEAEVKKTAEAKKYAEAQAADAKAYAAQKAADAELYERERQADAARIEAEKKAAADLALATAEAEAQKRLAEAIEAEGKAKAAAAQAQGLAEAEAIRAKAEAEAEGLMKKAEAMKQYGEAAMADMQMEVVKHYFSQLPAVAEAIGKGYNGVDKIVMLGNDSSQLAGNIMSTTTQISEGMEQALGIDLKGLLHGVLGAKLIQNSDNQ